MHDQSDNELPERALAHNIDLEPLPPGRGLAIGPSGPAWFVPRRQAVAENFNPYHDEQGRFTNADHAGGQHGADADGQRHHLGYTSEPTKDSAGRTSTIRGRSFEGKQSIADCVARALQTIIATQKGLGAKEAPALEEIKAKIAVEVARRNAEIEQMDANEKDPAKKSSARPSVDSASGLKAFGPSYMNIMARVLMQYGINTSASLTEDPKQRLTPKQLSDRLIAKGTPAVVNMGDEPKNRHAVTVQWDPQAGNDGKGRFLVNNIIAEGGTLEYTRQQFESGTLRVDKVGAGRDRKLYFLGINLTYPVIYAERR